MWCDAQRRVVERCDAPRRAALPTVMSISPTRLIDDPNMVQSRGDFKTALLPYGVRLTGFNFVGLRGIEWVNLRA